MDFLYFTFLVLTLVVIPFSLAIVLLFITFRKRNHYIGRKIRKKSSAVIAYKIANVSPYGDLFVGVSGGLKYKIVDKAEGPGFHAFKTIEEAQKSGLRGDFILEVLLYGNVSEYKKGYIASDQRVLQLIPRYNCYNCSHEKPTAYNFEDYQFLCEKCSKKPQAKFLTVHPLYGGVRKYRINLNWLADNKRRKSETITFSELLKREPENANKIAIGYLHNFSPTEEKREENVSG